MTFKTVLLSLLALAVLCSCDENRIFEKHNTNFPQFRWEKGQELSFKPTVEDTAADYSITLAMRHVNGFQFKELKVNVVITSPSGNGDVMNYTIPVMDSEGSYYSECALDLCDLEKVIEPKWHFAESGTYTYHVVHDMPVDILPNVMEIGLIIDKQQ